MARGAAGHKMGWDWERVWALEGRRLVLWLPVCLGLGIFGYFSWPGEPPPALGLVALPPALALATGLARRAGLGVLILVWALAGVTAGFALAQTSAHRAAAPVLAGEIEAMVEGRVIEVSASARGLPRVTLDRVAIAGLDPAATPARVRITLRADDATAPGPGWRLAVRARLSPPGGPAEPGGFDFALRAWFDQLGGIGYARDRAVARAEAPPDGWIEAAALWVAETRARIGEGVRAALPGRSGAIAAALIVNDRAAISEADNEALRISSLAHLLSISGLHMVIVTGLVFGLVRGGAALLPGVALRLPTKKIAAVAALIAAAGYLGLSGAAVASQRAFIMVAVAFVAILLDRPAISLRALALAAALVLALRPVSLLDAGFQMSFAATAALVAGYEVVAARGREARVAAPSRVQAVLRWLGVWLGGAVLTSLLAGAATAPFAAFHFNRSTPYGLIANLAAMPLTGVVIAPAAIAAGLLAPLGLAEPAFWVLGLGIEAVLQVAHGVAALPGADVAVAAAPGAVLGLMVAGGLWLMLWRGPWRHLGAVAVLAGLVLWPGAGARPTLLVAPGGGLIGLMGPEGRALSAARAEGFVAETWARRDGDQADQATAAARPGLRRRRGGVEGDLGDGWRVVLLRGRTAPDPATLAQACRARVLLIAPQGGRVSGPCTHLGADDLADPVAAWVEEGALVIQAGGSGPSRLWSR